MARVRRRGHIRRGGLSPERIQTLQMWSGFLHNFSDRERELFRDHFSATPDGRRYADQFLSMAQAWRDRTDQSITRRQFKQRWEGRS